MGFGAHKPPWAGTSTTPDSGTGAKNIIECAKFVKSMLEVSTPQDNAVQPVTDMT